MKKRFKDSDYFIAKHLRCCDGTRKRLLTSFDNNMLAPLLDEINQPSMDALHASFGTPKNVAALLMEQVTPEEASKYRRFQHGIKIAAGVLLAAILAFAIYAFFEKEFSNVSIIDEGPVVGDSYVID